MSSDNDADSPGATAGLHVPSTAGGAEGKLEAKPSDGLKQFGFAHLAFGLALEVAMTVLWFAGA